MNVTRHGLATAFAAAGLLCVVQVAGAAEWTVGQRVPVDTLTQSDWPKLTVGLETLRVLPSIEARSASVVRPRTLVVNALGVVGESRHSVLVARASADEVRSAVAGSGLQPLVADYYEHTRISLLRFARFEDAVRARDRLAEALGHAAVTVPVRYAERVAR